MTRCSLQRSYNGWTYTYDSMNRLTKATDGATTEQFWYDGLNRQIVRSASWTATRTVSVWDGWNLYAEFGVGSATRSERLLYGSGGDLVQSPALERYYYPDALGSTTYVADMAGALLESYTYDLYGTPTVYDSSGNIRSAGTYYGITQLFTGQKWYSQIGLYDNRARFLKPDLGRFLQPDPIGFAGDPANLYRYCANNPANASDPMGTAATRSLDGEPTNASAWGNPHAGGIPDFLMGPLGDAGAGVYVFNQGYAGTPLYGPTYGGTVFGGPGNRTGLSYNGRPVTGIYARNGASTSGDSISMGLVYKDSTNLFNTPDMVLGNDIVLPVIRQGNLAIDTDGTGSSHGDPDYKSFTSYTIGGVSLNSDVDPYVATPTSALNLGVRAGDTAFVIGNGHWMTGVVGDFGSPGWGEVSLAMASGLGVATINRGYGPVPNTRGGAAVPVTFIIIPSAIPRPPPGG